MALEDFNTIVLESETNEMNLWHIAMIKIEMCQNKIFQYFLLHR